MLKSYEYLNTPLQAESLAAVAVVAKSLKDLGFKIITGAFGANPSITVQDDRATVRLNWVFTGQFCDVDGIHKHTFTAVYRGVKILCHKPLPTIH